MTELMPSDSQVSFSDFIQKNFISLTVSNADETPMLVTDVATQSLVGVLAQWCGALGFWLGLSAMTVFELIQLVYAVINTCKEILHHTSVVSQLFSVILYFLNSHQCCYLEDNP